MHKARLSPIFSRLALGISLALALAACGKPALYTQQSYVFGTQVEVTIADAPEAQARAAANAVLREFDRLHQAFHAWHTSPVTQLNAAFARGEPMHINPELAAAIRDARSYAEASDHLFNPAIGGLIRLWGFQSEEFVARLPQAAQVAAWVATQPRLSDISIDAQSVASSRNRAVQLDFGGYAKGLALDHALHILRAQGIHNALVNIGGNLIALGQHGERPWHIGVQAPRGPGALVEMDLRDGEAIGTSGDYQRYFELDGRRYCHIIDPRTGFPAAHTQSITVLAPPGPHAGVLSDVASKPAFIAGAQEWQARLLALGIKAAMRVDESGKIAMTEAMAQRATPVRRE